MIVFLNDRFVPEEDAVVSVFDRGFLYGDGLFETLPAYRGQPFRWPQHFRRLQHGADFLGLPLPYSAEALERAMRELIRRNQMPEATVRVVVSRGCGPRGYSPRDATHPTTVISLHPLPLLAASETRRWRLALSSFTVPVNQPLHTFKTCNRLACVLARAEAEAAGADEALLLNTQGNIAEAASSNLFWTEHGVVCTSPAEQGALAGITRAIVLELCPALGLEVRQSSIAPAALTASDGVFLTLSTVGLVEATHLGAQPLRSSPLFPRLRRAYLALVEHETNTALNPQR